MVGNAYEKHEHKVDWKVQRVNASESVTEPGVWKWRVGIHKKPDLLEAFHERRMCKFSWESGGLLRPKKLNTRLAEMQFPAVLRGLLAPFSLFLVDILSCSQFRLHPHSYPTISIYEQMWTNYETNQPFLTKWGYIPSQTPLAGQSFRQSAPLPFFRCQLMEGVSIKRSIKRLLLCHFKEQHSATPWA